MRKDGRGLDSGEITAAPPGVTDRGSRWLGLAGLGLAVSGALTWMIAPIAMPETAEAVSAHYDANRTALIVTSILVVGGNAIVAAWYVALAAVASDTSCRRLLGLIGVIGMAIQIAVVSAGFTLFAAVAYRQPEPTPLSS